MKIESYGKDIERLDVSKIEPRDDVFLTKEDLPILFENMYLLGKEDMDLVLLLFVSRKKQEDIGNIFGVTQEAISYQLKKLKLRIKFIKRLRIAQSRVDEFFQFTLDSGIPEHFIEASVLMFYTTSQTASAQVLNVNQATVRYRFNCFVDLLKKLKLPRKFRKTVRYVKGLRNFHNQVKRVKRG